MRKIVLSFFIMLAVAAGITLHTAQAETTGASAFIDKLGNDALTVLGKKETPKAETQEKFREMLNANFDINGIGRFVLGRPWQAATPAQRDEYTTLFKKMVEQIYTDRFSNYSGQSFKIIGERKDSERDQIVTTQIINVDGTPPVAVDWRVRKQDDGSFKIYDVIVEGVSMSVTQRSEFASVIQRNGGSIEGLLKTLREKTASK